MIRESKPGEKQMIEVIRKMSTMCIRMIPPWRRIRGRSMCRFVVLAALILALIAPASFAQEISLEAEVDRTTVKFGDSLTLTLTLSQALSGQANRQFVTPNIDSIPDFDIAGRRTSQNMTFINGVGQLQVQTSLELVPRGPGDFTIPAMALKLPDGRTVNSKAIKVKVLPPEEEPAAAQGQGSAQPPAVEEDDTSRVTNGRGTSLFKAFSMLLVIVAIVILLPILLSWYLSGRNAPARPRGAAGSAGQPAGASGDSDGTEAEDAKVVSPAIPREQPVDFDREVERLKREIPEASLEFYNIYFDIFHRAVVSANSRLNAMQTPDELRKSAEEHFPPAVAARMRTIVDEWEGVAYARFAPSRAFSVLHDDARAIVRALTTRQETHR